MLQISIARWWFAVVYFTWLIIRNIYLSYLHSFAVARVGLRIKAHVRTDAVRIKPRGVNSTINNKSKCLLNAILKLIVFLFVRFKSWGKYRKSKGVKKNNNTIVCLSIGNHKHDWFSKDSISLKFVWICAVKIILVLRCISKVAKKI